MHDPNTLAFSIKSPFSSRESSLVKGEKYYPDLVSIWHVDPEKDHTDDSCGWFPRARHGGKEVLEKIEGQFDFDWDREFRSDDGNRYYRSYFMPISGDPAMSVQGIVLNLFFLAAIQVFKTRHRAARFMNKNLFEILFFAENPTDSLRDSILQSWGKEGNRKQRIHSIASCIYGWILRESRPWWKHPRWHVHHWRIQIHPLQKLNRWLFKRCKVCGKRFGYNETPMGSWSGNAIWHQSCDSTSNPAAK